MKKTMAMILAMALGFSALTGCSSSSTSTTEAQTTAAATEEQTTAAATEAATTAEADHYPVTIDTYNYNKDKIQMTFESCPQKVICTNQTQTEMLLYFGLDQYIAGVAYLDGDIREDLQDQYNALKDAGKELTVTGYPSKEAVLALEPDFIFGWRSAFADDALGDVSEWNEIGVNTMILRCSNNTAEDLSINSVLADIQDIGAIFNIEDKTDAYIADANDMLNKVQDKVNSLSDDEVLTAILIEPMDGSFYAWPSNCLSGSLLEAAGAKNIVTEGAEISVEDIVALNPDVIIVDYMSASSGDDEAAKADAIASITSESALAEVPAVANNKVMGINLTDIYGGGIRMIPSVETMYEFMYGE